MTANHQFQRLSLPPTKPPMRLSLLLLWLISCSAFVPLQHPHRTAFTPTSLKMSLMISYLKQLDVKVKLILASQSPRRREILDMMGLADSYQATPSPLDESALQARLRGMAPTEYTQTLAEKKAEALALTLEGDQIPTLVLGSDTIVDLNGVILEKPFDTDSAIKMLHQLSGNAHHVHTGVAIYLVDKEAELVTSFVDTADVTFADLSEDDIRAYVETQEPMDKAGSYGIQGKGGQFVTSMNGDFFTVMGLPMHRTSTELANAMKKVIEG